MHSFSFASRIDASLARSQRCLSSPISWRIHLPSSVSENPAASVAVITSPVAKMDDNNLYTSTSVAERS